MAKYCLECGVKAQDAARTCLSCGGSKFRGEGISAKLAAKPITKPTAKEPRQISEQEYRRYMMASADEVTGLIRDFRRYLTIVFVIAVLTFIVNTLVRCIR